LRKLQEGKIAFRGNLPPGPPLDASLVNIELEISRSRVRCVSDTLSSCAASVR